MNKNFEKNLIKKEWISVTPRKGVKIFLKSTPFNQNNSHLQILNVGLLKDNQWDNYCLFAGDEMYLDEKIDSFLIECKMREDWNKRIKDNIYGI
jgi:hypothetical protein